MAWICDRLFRHAQSYWMTALLGSTLCRETLIDRACGNRQPDYAHCGDGRDLHQLFAKVDVVSGGRQNGSAPRPPPELWSLPPGWRALWFNKWDRHDGNDNKVSHCGTIMLNKHSITVSTFVFIFLAMLASPIHQSTRVHRYFPFALLSLTPLADSSKLNAASIDFKAIEHVQRVGRSLFLRSWRDHRVGSVVEQRARDPASTK
jgi:hypothetical protein